MIINSVVREECCLLINRIVEMGSFVVSSVYQARKEPWLQIHILTKQEIFAQKASTVLQVKLEHKIVMLELIIQIREDIPVTIAQLDNFVKQQVCRSQQIVILDTGAQLRQIQ
jgi:hypothetical protein